jgi:hypothetical protein
MIKRICGQVSGNIFLVLWKEKMNNCSDGKLQTYTKVKTRFGCEKYLKLRRNFELRRSMSFLSSFADRVGQVPGYPSTPKALSTVQFRRS